MTEAAAAVLQERQERLPTAITVRNFGCLQRIDRLPLRPLNVLIGANGAGKSQFLDAFAVLTTRGTWRRGMTRFERLVKRRGTWIELSTGERFLEYSYDGAWTEHRTEGYLPRDETRWWQVYDFADVSALQQAATKDYCQRLDRDGHNLGAMVYHLRAEHPSVYDLLVRLTRLVQPLFHDFHLPVYPDQVSPAGPQVRLQWQPVDIGRPWFYADALALGGGTLRFIALATLLLAPPEHRPLVVLLNQPEVGLHPAAVGHLHALLVMASLDSCLVVETHSETLLDHCEPADVVVLEPQAHGTVAQRLSSARLAPWLADFSLGQLWAKNELGGRPRQLMGPPVCGAGPATVTQMVATALRGAGEERTDGGAGAAAATDGDDTAPRSASRVAAGE